MFKLFVFESSITNLIYSKQLQFYYILSGSLKLERYIKLNWKGLPVTSNLAYRAHS